ncbi:MAG TPA: hypothetical protein VF600_18300 [Abditibacteriaceae bacterium]|jgi:hypothetical protein
MRIGRIFIYLVLAGLSFNALSSAVKCQDAPDRDVSAKEIPVEDLPLTSVLLRAKDVLAVNSDGVYRASRADKVWTKMTLPEGLEPVGAFASQPENSRLLLYRNGSGACPQAQGNQNSNNKLFLSQDDGQTWRVILQSTMIGPVFLHPNGTIFAMTYGTPTNVHLLQSPDLGATWRDISANPMPVSATCFVDPDHPNLVKIIGWLASDDWQKMDGHVAVLQADDETYQWHEVKDTQNQTFPWHKTGGADAGANQFRATLGNYFQYDFAGSIWKLVYDVIPAKSSYRFSSTQPKVIEVAMTMYARGDDGNQGLDAFPLDENSGIRFWGVDVTTPQGESTYIPPQYDKGWVSMSQEPVSKPQLLNELLTRGQVQTIHLSPEQPYVRKLDLDKLYRFDQVGTYKIRVTYESTWLKQYGYREFGKQWLGNFAGQMFEVTITKPAQ